MPDLSSSVILVTGANRGQGRAIAGHLVHLGSTVVIGARSHEKAVEAAKALGTDKAYPVQLDVTKEGEWLSALKEITSVLGRIDGLVNNAGMLTRKPFAETSAEEYLQLIQVNQLGTFLGMQSVIPYMEPQKKGAIVNNVSVSAFSPIEGSAAYAASKAAVVAMSKAAAVELGPKGIRVNMIHPGGINTEMAGKSQEELDAYRTVPLQRIGEPDEIAKAAAFLLSDDSSYCTGAELVVDGGMTLGSADY